jgi:hypothetical protein
MLGNFSTSYKGKFHNKKCEMGFKDIISFPFFGLCLSNQTLTMKVLFKSIEWIAIEFKYHSNQLHLSNDHYKFFCSPIGDGVKFYTWLLILCLKKIGKTHKLHYVEE